MACERLLNGIDLRCVRPVRKYEQKVVFLNRSEINREKIESSMQKNRADLILRSNAIGKAVYGSENGSEISGTFSKTEERNRAMYNHTVSIPVVGISEEILTFLKQIDNSDVCAAIRFKDGRVLIFGLCYGLKTSAYTYTPQSSSGGATIQLESRYTEYDPPYLYSGDPTDFDNDFESDAVGGSFNNDYNKDFEI